MEPSRRSVEKTRTKDRSLREEREWMDGSSTHILCVVLSIPLSPSASGPFLWYRALVKWMSWDAERVGGTCQMGARVGCYTFSRTAPDPLRSRPKHVSSEGSKVRQIYVT
jgi:hypothetical protein